MCDEWMPALQLPLTWEQFEQLPRHPAYRYEYLDGLAYLSPRARHYHAQLDLSQADFTGSPPQDADELELCRVQADDWPELMQLFAEAFHRTQPYGSLTDAVRLEAAKHALERTRTGGDGPWLQQASFVAVDRQANEPSQRLLGAIFITLLPDGDPCEWDSYYWTGPPPANCVEQCLGRPHLTWIFVAPLLAGRGVGTLLLGAAVRELLALGYPQLVSTFMIGNDSSMLWHWRNGFRLLAYPGSFRRKRTR